MSLYVCACNTMCPMGGHVLPFLACLGYALHLIVFLFFFFLYHGVSRIVLELICMYNNNNNNNKTASFQDAVVKGKQSLRTPSERKKIVHTRARTKDMMATLKDRLALTASHTHPVGESDDDDSDEEWSSGSDDD